MTLTGKKKKKKDEPTGMPMWAWVAIGVTLIVAAAVAAWWIGECNREERLDQAAERIDGYFITLPGSDVTAEIGGAFRDLLGAKQGIDRARELAVKHGRIVYHDGLGTVWYGFRLGTIGNRQACIGTVRQNGGDRPDVVHTGFGPGLEIEELRLDGTTLTVVVTTSTSKMDAKTVAALGLEPGARYEAVVDVTKIGDRPVGPKELGTYRKVAIPEPDPKPE